MSPGLQSGREGVKTRPRCGPKRAPLQPVECGPTDLPVTYLDPGPRGSELSSTHPVFIALGSNLDTPPVQLERAVEALRQAPELHNIRVSEFRWTAPEGPVADQPVFLNGAIAAESSATPHELLARLQAIETELGLDRFIKTYQGPRRIDLDLLFVGSLEIDDDTLTLPHPGIPSRRFVLDPLLDLAPDFVHPATGLTVREHHARLEAPPCAA